MTQHFFPLLQHYPLVWKQKNKKVSVRFDVDDQWSEISLARIISNVPSTRRKTTVIKPLVIKVLGTLDATQSILLPSDSDLQKIFGGQAKQNFVYVSDRLCSSTHVRESDLQTLSELFEQDAYGGRKKKTGAAAKEEIEERKTSAKLVGTNGASVNGVLVNKPLELCKIKTGPNAGMIKKNNVWIREKMNVPRHYADTEQEIVDGPLIQAGNGQWVKGTHLICIVIFVFVCFCFATVVVIIVFEQISHHHLFFSCFCLLM